MCDWLPDLVVFEDYGGSWDKYLETLYLCYTADFIDSQPIFKGEKIGRDKEPYYKSKERTFWHIIQGEIDVAKMDLIRCSYVKWPKAILEKVPHSKIKEWRNKRKSRKHICLWFNDEYLIVIQIRRRYKVAYTAYPTLEGHRKRKLQKEYEEWVRSGATG